MKKCLAMITMNAGYGIPGSTIRETLDASSDKFDKVIVIDGDFQSEAREYYAQLVEKNRDGETEFVFVDSPWKDSYVAQYRAWRDEVDDGDWVLYLDCDEVPSDELIEFLGSDEFDRLSKKHTTICLPCVLHLREGERYFAAEGPPKKEFEGQWLKNILIKNDSHLDFKHFGSHVIPNHGTFEDGVYVPYPYYHMKSLESFVYNDVWQAFLSPEGQQYSKMDASMFRMLTKSFKETSDFKRATKDGKWILPLQKFAWDRRKYFNNPVSRLAWVYYILEGHEMPEDDPWMTWENVKDHVLGEKEMAIFAENIELGNIHEWK